MYLYKSINSGKLLTHLNFARREAMNAKNTKVLNQQLKRSLRNRLKVNNIQ